MLLLFLSPTLVTPSHLCWVSSHHTATNIPLLFWEIPFLLWESALRKCRLYLHQDIIPLPALSVILLCSPWDKTDHLFYCLGYPLSLALPPYYTSPYDIPYHTSATTPTDRKGACRSQHVTIPTPSSMQLMESERPMAGLAGWVTLSWQKSFLSNDTATLYQWMIVVCLCVRGCVYTCVVHHWFYGMNEISFISHTWQ